MNLENRLEKIEKQLNKLSRDFILLEKCLEQIFPIIDVLGEDYYKKEQINKKQEVDIYG